MHNFKKALSRILIFSLLILLIGVPIISVYLTNTYFHYQDNRVRDSLAGQLDTLYVGSSEGLRGLSPTVMDYYNGTNGYNLSSAMMTMCGRYWLLKHEISRNDIDLVILELSYESMARDREEEGPEGDIPVIGKLPNMAMRAQYIMESFPIDEIPWLYYHLIEHGAKAISYQFDEWDFDTDEETLERRGYTVTTTNDVSLTQEEYLRLYHTSNIDTTIVASNEQYLQKISDLCWENGIELVLITLPQARSYTTEYADLQVLTDYYHDFADANGWSYYDFNLLKDRDTLFPETEAFNDITHLSHTGAWYATHRLSELIMLEQAGEDTDTYFYETHAEMDQSRGYIRRLPE